MRAHRALSQTVGLTRESRGCYTRESSLLRGFQQRVAAALQQAIACRVYPKENSRVSIQCNLLERLSLRLRFLHSQKV